MKRRRVIAILGALSVLSLLLPATVAGAATLTSATYNPGAHSLAVTWTLNPGESALSVDWSTSSAVLYDGTFTNGNMLRPFPSGNATSLTADFSQSPGTYYINLEYHPPNSNAVAGSNVMLVNVLPTAPAPPPDAALPPVNFRMPGGTRLAAQRGRRYRLNLCRPAPRRGDTCGPGSNQRNPSGGEGGPYVFNLKTGRGALPRGLRLNSRTGLLSGTLSGSPGIYNFVVCAKDMGGTSSQHQTVCTSVRLRVRP